MEMMDIMEIMEIMKTMEMMEKIQIMLIGHVILFTSSQVQIDCLK